MCYIILISLVPDAERFSIFESSLLHISTYLIHKSVSAWDILPHLTRDFFGSINEAKYLRIDQVKFVEDSLQKVWSDMVCFLMELFCEIS